jgi:hypothetical protein
MYDEARAGRTRIAIRLGLNSPLRPAYVTVRAGHAANSSIELALLVHVGDTSNMQINNMQINVAVNGDASLHVDPANACSAADENGQQESTWRGAKVE